MSRGFTLIEMIVVIAIIAVLSGIILFTITQYISKGKDSNIAANMNILIPAGEVFYNGNGNSYNNTNNSPPTNFCDPQVDSAMKNVMSQMPVQSSGAPCYSSDTNSSWTSVSNIAGLCCYASSDGNSWAACATEFTNSANYYCVDSRGMKEGRTGTCNQASLTQGSSYQCP